MTLAALSAKSERIAHVRADDVARDPGEPGCWSRFAAKGLAALEGSDQDSLRRVLGLARTPEAGGDEGTEHEGGSSRRRDRKGSSGGSVGLGVTRSSFCLSASFVLVFVGLALRPASPGGVTDSGSMTSASDAEVRSWKRLDVSSLIDLWRERDFVSTAWHLADDHAVCVTRQVRC